MTRVSCFLLGLLLAACAAPPASAPQRMSVFFTAWSAEFDDGSSAVLKQVAKEMRATPDRSLTIIGSADPSGSAQANRDVSRLRTQVVFDSLVAEGVAPGRIRRELRGATEFASMPQESRRVDLVLSN